MSTPNGGPAFPCHTNPLPGKLANAPQGMTLRQYYKAAALQGLLANPEDPGAIESAAAFAGRYADAMLAEDEEHARK